MKPDLSDILQHKVPSLVHHHRNQILSMLKYSMVSMENRKAYTENIYNVPAPRVDLRETEEQPALENVLQYPIQFVCDVAQKVKLHTIMRNDTFFNKEQLGPYLPAHPLEILRNLKVEHEQMGAQQSHDKTSTRYKYENCGVVSSAGSLLKSNLGSKIDSNDFVIRFNNAPTKGYEKDVGAKTSLMIVNSQVVSNPEFGFLDDHRTKNLYSESPILVLDASNYNASIEEWYGKPDVPFFERYFAKRRIHPDSEVHLLNPNGLWSIWDWLQSIHKDVPLPPTPPTSGFLGLILAVLHCTRVYAYEFVPSIRLTSRCHYYEEGEDLGCAIGGWHPRAAEKLAALYMNVGSDIEVYKDGYVTIPGLLSLDQPACINNSKT